MKKNEWLESAIIDYVRREPGADAPQVASFMWLDIKPLAAIASLIKKGIPERYWNERHYALRVIK